MIIISNFSALLGYISIFFWLGAQFPQILKNFRRQSCEGLAPFLLANWFLGDFSNLVGCIFTHQLPFQTWLATYFVCIDVVLFTQYICYSRRSKTHENIIISIERNASQYHTFSVVVVNPVVAAALVTQPNEQGDKLGIGGPGRSESTGTGRLPGPLRPSVSLISPDQRQASTEVPGSQIVIDRRNTRIIRKGVILIFSVWVIFCLGASLGNGGGVPDTRVDLGEILTGLAENTQYYNALRHGKTASRSIFSERVIGRIFAWLCASLYLTSRIPQIWKNHVRKSTEGLSMFLFISAFLGNTFYAASILTSPKLWLPVPASTEFIRESIPYLLGSGGTVIFDVIIITQSFMYRPRPSRHSMTQSGIGEDDHTLHQDRTSRTELSQISLI